MHMADALISPAVGGAMWVASAGLAAWSARKLKQEGDERMVPLMGVLSAFVFSAQMINFAVPGTGSSGHLGGGLILAILLGPHAAFLSIFSILTVQALFFADGGLLALGCNTFNLGFWPCFVAYPLLFRRIVCGRPSTTRMTVAAVLSGVVALQFGAFSVVLETLASGISELPFSTFALLMQPLHLAIGVIEGLVTAAVVTFVWRTRPEILAVSFPVKSLPGRITGGTLRPLSGGILLVSIITGCLLSGFASSHPDGLEWSVFKTSGREELSVPESSVHASAAQLQSWTALLPDYDFKAGPDGAEGPKAHEEVPALDSIRRETGGAESQVSAPFPVASAGTSLSGALGGAFVLLLTLLIGRALRRAEASA